MRHDDRLKDATIHESYPLHKTPVHSHIDSLRIRQVLINLLHNAADAIQSNANGEITVTVTNEGGSVLVTVKDNGKGILPEYRDRIFDPFFTTKGELGLGLGLDICHRIVEDHKGTLTFTTSLDVGTSFKLCLPGSHLDADTCTVPELENPVRDLL